MYWNASGGADHFFVGCHFISHQGDVAMAAGQPKKRTFKKFTFRGVNLDALLDMSTNDLIKVFPAHARRRFQKGLKRKLMALIKSFARQ